VAATKLAQNILLLLAKAFYAALDFESVKRTWIWGEKALPPQLVHSRICLKSLVQRNLEFLNEMKLIPD